MKKKIFFYFLAYISFYTFSQEEVFNTKKDSIAVYLKLFKEKNDLKLFEKAAKIAQAADVDYLIKETNIKFGLASFNHKNNFGLLISQKNLLQLYKRTKDSFALAKYYHYKALSNRILYINDSSFYYYHKSKNISIAIKDSIQVARRLLSISLLQNEQRHYLGSEISTIEGLKYIEPLKEIKYTASLYNNLGLALSGMGKQKEARVFFEKFFELNKQKLDKYSKDKSNLGYYINVGLTYNIEKNYKKSIAFLKKGLDFDSLEYKFPYKYQRLHANLADSYFDSGNKEKALKGFNIVLKSEEKHNNLYGQSISHSLLANYYIDKKDNKKALFHVKKGLKLAKLTNNSERVLSNLIYLGMLIKGEKGKEYLYEYIQLSDSLYNRERTLKNQFAKIRYDTEKKDKENTILKEENTKKQLLIEREQQQKTIGWLLAGASILFIGFGTTVVLSRRKKMLFEAKLQQVEAREKERQQIAKSLHDEVAGDIRILHLKLAKSNQIEEANSLDIIKENVRNLSHQLSSESFEAVSFKDQIINLVSDYFEIDFKIKVEEIDSILWKNVDNSIKRTLFLAVRESIQNAKKHAEASILRLFFTQTKKAIVVTISDNGKGFNVTSKKNGVGLKNLKERIEEINGVFTLQSEIVKGTKITIEIITNGN